MEFDNLEKKPIDEKGETVVFATASADAVNELLTQFYGVVGRSKGLGPDASWGDIDEAASASMGVIDYRELRRDFVVNRILSDALAELGVTPAITPNIHVLEYPAAGEPFAVEASIVERPNITLTSYEPVTVQMDEVVIDDVIIGTRVADLLEHFATYEEIEPRMVKAGDIISLKMDTMQAGKLVPRLSGNKMTLAIDGESMPATFFREIVGMEVGEEKTFDYQALREKAISDNDVELFTATVKILAQLKKVDVELTDEWVAENYPEVGTVENFFAEAKKDAEYDALVFNRDTLAHLANNELAKRLEGKIPDAFYQASYKNLMDKFEQDLADQHKTLEDYYNEEKSNEQELSVQMLIKSGENLKQGFALEALFDGRNMEITDAEIEEAGTRFFGRDETVDDLKRGGRYRLAESMAKREKALKWLVETAIVEKESE